MLNAYIRNFDKLPNLEIIHDVEKGFNRYNIIDMMNPEVNSILEYIDGAHIGTNNKLYDRFGNDMRVDYLSTGCKAALLLYFVHDKIIDTVECGINALEAIIYFCKDGYAIFPGFRYWVELDDGKDISLNIRGKKLMTTDEYNAYVRGDDIDEW